MRFIIGYLLICLGATISYIVGFQLGKKRGHLEGHKCEAVMQIFFEDFQAATRKDKDERLP